MILACMTPNLDRQIRTKSLESHRLLLYLRLRGRGARSQKQHTYDGAWLDIEVDPAKMDETGVRNPSQIPVSTNRQ